MSAAHVSVEALIPYVDTPDDRIDISFENQAFTFAVRSQSMVVRNGRVATPRPSLGREGFELASWPSGVVRERCDELIRENSQPRETMAPVNADYLAAHVPLIERLSGVGCRLRRSRTLIFRLRMWNASFGRVWS